MELLDRIVEHSTVPKYLQVVNAVISDIESGILKHGQRIPSINETSEMYYLSRDTVEKAYKELREKGIITSVRGKGNYICQNFSTDKIRVLLLFNKLSAYKKTVYYSLLKSFGEDAIVDLHIHHYNGKICENLILENLGKYHYFVVMPHFFEHTETIMQTLHKIPPHKLVFLDKNLAQYTGDCAAVYQDFERDIYSALHSGIDLLYKYQKLVLVFPKDLNYPPEIVKGFQRFCQETSFAYSVIDGLDSESITAKTAFIVLEESDLVDLIKHSRTENWQLGKDIGIISYNETPLKEILANGITVISTDHAKMGETAAYMMLHKRKGKVINPFTLIRRNSL
ncbi:GntR family transcriptional regulator [Adhaeribacter pallidiroseus]|uniref:Arabinose metabolism transcriptional repressor n=1 Tax=Adhaeribacter pallidiroseus TaxID=2072847 RepID=A0A369QDH3_9BACT|nr:GntR family transcriptional regulator [Adhaeribacter pallidiroseus]RDC62754.1 Arabinose metabolism transcriptional repressor [Adhaeribacter pallidiroseus]